MEREINLKTDNRQSPPDIAHCEKLFEEWDKIEDKLMKNGKMTDDQAVIDKVMEELRNYHKSHPELDKCGDI